MQLLNWQLLAQPYNWIIVVLILAFSAFALCLFFGPNAGQWQVPGM